MSVNLTDPIFTDADKAREYLEAVRWPHGAVCPRCGSANRITKMEGESYRAGLYRCGARRRQFTVTVGTVCERSHVPLNKWLLAARLPCSSKKGMSAHQLHRTIEVTSKTAWCMAHRIREAVRPAGTPEGMGGEGKIVEADETYFGSKEDPQPSPNRKGRPYVRGGKHGPAAKRAVIGSVERGGEVRTFHVDGANSATIKVIARTNISRESKLVTDEARLYTDLGNEFRSHGTVVHNVWLAARLGRCSFAVTAWTVGGIP